MLDEMMPILINILIWVVVGVLLLYSVRWFNKRARTRLESICLGANDSKSVELHKVRVTYHTYYGILVWVTQQQHEFTLPPEEAKVLLRKLKNFNMKFGISAYGFIFIPILSYGNYWAQLRSIKMQVGQSQRAI